MSSSFRLCLLIGLLALEVGSPGTLTAAEEARRTFPAQKCRYTLPGPDWTWIDREVPNVLFMAGNTKGFVINLSTVKTPTPVEVNEEFAKGFEKEYYQPGQVDKRAGRFVTFRGLPTYQTEGVLSDGRTSATRVFATHGFVYHLTLLGTKEPIEGHPTFETLMQGFDFTTPPKQDRQGAGKEAAEAPAGQVSPVTHSEYGKALSISAWMGRIVGVCIIGVIAMLVFRWAFRKRTSKKKEDSGAAEPGAADRGLRG